MPTDPLPDQDLAAISAFIARHHVLTLATTLDGEVWAASCFYAFDRAATALLVMTDPATRHGRMMTAVPAIAGTIAGQPRVIERIQGVQFAATARCLASVDEGEGRRRYLRRFPAAALAPAAPLWSLRLDEVKMTDNLLGFARKRRWVRLPPASSKGRT
jgi:hypothetical protein